MKKFIGYYIIGANTKEDAQNEKGLMLWSPNKPNVLKRWFTEMLLGIYWIDKDRVVGGEQKGKSLQSTDQPVELAKAPVKEEKAVKESKPVQEAPRKPRQTPRVPRESKS